MLRTQGRIQQAARLHAGGWPEELTPAWKRHTVGINAAGSLDAASVGVVCLGGGCAWGEALRVTDARSDRRSAGGMEQGL